MLVSSVGLFGHACPLRALIVVGRVMMSCQGDVRMFDAFSFQSWIFTAVSSAHLHFRLVGHQLMSGARKENVCDELSGSLQMIEDITC